MGNLWRIIMGLTPSRHHLRPQKVKAVHSHQHHLIIKKINQKIRKEEITQSLVVRKSRKEKKVKEKEVKEAKARGGIKKGKGWKEADEKQQTIKDPWNKNETETDETNSKNNLNGYDESTEGKDQTKGNGVTEKEDYGKYEYVEKDTYQNKWWWG